MLTASVARIMHDESSRLRCSRTTISERVIPIGRQKGCSTQVPFDRGRAPGVLWPLRVARVHREFRFRSDTEGLTLGRTQTNRYFITSLATIPRGRVRRDRVFGWGGAIGGRV